MLARVFASLRDGFYVDVGAADPVNLSVTKWFYDSGWSGINIEPNRALFERLVAARPRDVNLDCGAGAVASQVTFLEQAIGELSSFDPRVQAHAREIGAASATRVVSVVPLTDILDKYAAGRTIDFLKIDVEGWESEVLRGIDLHRYRPTIILVEATFPQSSVESHTVWEHLLLKENYIFSYFDGVNRFYIAGEHAELGRHFNSPPNVFDDFEPIALVRARFDAAERLAEMQRLESELAEAKARLAKKQKLEPQPAEANARPAEANASLSHARNSLIWKLSHPRSWKIFGSPR